ncbi:hypothetical protein [Pseudomonas aeruginosa]|uniref:hypothetical protein n=1 Tax=Pseudomonas aeruginosa TaxID=287 RepID=UPI000935DDDD|nr:hypothetical protein [Pseudomonas aeruginosa]
MTESKICTCPSGDGSLRWPCPKHPAVEHAGGDERAAFERAFIVQEGIYFDDKRSEYRSMNLREIEVTDAQDLNLRLQGWQARAALAQPSPVRSSLLINGYQLRAALDFIAPDGTAEQLESEACIEWRQQDADFLEAGLYAFCAEYPEEGGVLLDEEPTTAQPSPLQSEQAEAERPEVVAYFDRNYPSTGDAFIWSNYEGSPYEPVMTVAQHDRIAGALRAENAQLSEDLNRLSIIRARLNLRLDFALDKISKLESRWPHGESPEERFEHYISNTIDRAPEPLRRLGNWLSHVLDEDQWTTAERMLTGACVAAEERAAAQTQHSVPEGWKPVPIEPLLNMMSDKDHDTRIMAERQLLSILADAPGKEVGHE